MKTSFYQWHKSELSNSRHISNVLQNVAERLCTADKAYAFILVHPMLSQIYEAWLSWFAIP